MKIGHLQGVTQQHAAEYFRGMSDTELIAQELVQKGAIHTLETMRARQLDPELMLEGLNRLALVLGAELRRRGLPAVDELET